MDDPCKQFFLSPLVVVLLALLVASTTGCATRQIQAPLAPETPELMSSNGYPIYVEVRSSHSDRTDVELVPSNFAPLNGLLLGYNRAVSLAISHDGWLTEGLQTAFRRAGFQTATEHTSQAPAIFASVEEFRGEQLSGFMFIPFGFVASFDVTLRIPTTDQDVFFQRTFAATTREYSFAGTSSRKKEALIRDVLDEVFTEIVEETFDLLSSGR